MGLYLIFGILFILSIGVFKKTNSCSLEVWSMLVAIISGIILFILITLSLCIIAEDISVPCAYEVHKDYLISVKNKDISIEERQLLVRASINYNNRISKSKIYREKFLVNCFIPKNISELELINLADIPQAKLNIDLKGLNIK